MFFSSSSSDSDGMSECDMSECDCHSNVVLRGINMHLILSSSYWLTSSLV
jgi:hypothetical protein